MNESPLGTYTSALCSEHTTMFSHHWILQPVVFYRASTQYTSFTQQADVSVSRRSVTKYCREAGSLKSGVGRPMQLAGKTRTRTSCMDSEWLSIILMLSSVPHRGGQHQPYLQMSQLHLREGLLIFSTLCLHSQAQPPAHPSLRWRQCFKASGWGSPSPGPV